jgi:hypothetical protein
MGGLRILFDARRPTGALYAAAILISMLWPVDATGDDVADQIALAAIRNRIDGSTAC